VAVAGGCVGTCVAVAGGCVGTCVAVAVAGGCVGIRVAVACGGGVGVCVGGLGVGNTIGHHGGKMKVPPDDAALAWGVGAVRGAPEVRRGVGVGDGGAGLNHGGSEFRVIREGGSDGLAAWTTLGSFIGKAARAMARPPMATIFRMG